MKRPILLWCLLVCLTTGVKAFETTTDHFEISPVTVAPGGNYAYFDVSVSGSRLYSAYNLDITFPQGLSVYYSGGKPAVSMLRNGGIYPSNEDILTGDVTYPHTLACSYGAAGERMLRIACYSVPTSSFTAESGKLFRVFIEASPYLKPGTVELKFSGQNLTTADATKYVPAETTFTVNVTDESKVPVSITAANQWATLVLPFDHPLPEGMQAYTCQSVSGDNLLLSEAASLEAYKPYIVYAENGFSETLTGTVDASKYVAVASDGYLNGAVQPQEVTSGYVLQNKGDGAQFYAIDGTFAIGEGRCWLTVPSAARSSFALPNNGTTGITTVASDDADQTVYTLSGQRVSTTQRGRIYIIGGKKVLK